MVAWFDWSALRNPIYEYDSWSVKDACIAHRDDRFTLVFSAFFAVGGRERSHIVAVQSPDLRTFSEPRFLRSGQAAGWKGLCSPNLTVIDDCYVLTYNSWGDHPRRPNQLFYAISHDLMAWDFDHPLAPELTCGVRAIDATVINYGSRYYLTWKERQSPVVAWASDLDGPWQRIGNTSGGWFENAEFLILGDRVHLLVTGRDHCPYLMCLLGDPEDPEGWRHWSRPTPLVVPQEDFNTHDRANAAFLVDWRHHDGYAYLLYAGTTEGHSHAGRGDNRLGLARSRDLETWSIPSGESEA